MPPSDLRRLAEELLTLGAVRDAIDAEYRSRRAALQAEYEELGLERQRIVTDNKLEFGTVVLANGTLTVEITDRDAMMDWLKSHRPDMIVTRQDIDPTFWRLIVEVSRSAGVGVDPEGTVLDWVRVSTGPRSLRATPTRDAKEMIKDAIQNTGIQFALEASD